MKQTHFNFKKINKISNVPSAKTVVCHTRNDEMKIKFHEASKSSYPHNNKGPHSKSVIAKINQYVK